MDPLRKNDLETGPARKILLSPQKSPKKKLLFFGYMILFKKINEKTFSERAKPE